MKPPPYALRLAARGIPVFPCNAKKRPCTRHGFKDATVDTAELIALWRERPGPLIGFPTGPASGLDLLDIDPRHGGDVWLAHHLGHLGETLTVRTRSGGTHLFFKHWPGMRNSESAIAPGVDVRGEGGYAIAWAGCGGSIVKRVPARHWPGWLGRIARPQPKQTAGATRDAPVIEGNTHARRVMQRWLDKVSSASAGQRHYTLRGASCVIGGLLNRGIAFEEAEKVLLQAVLAAGGKKVDEENAKLTIASGLQRGKDNPFESAA